ncbi:MAG: polymorphic toxin-type HINT domain-containing protein [Planctomycetota bacterium]|nr:polymorphic toxin-type HINT domain-containing protein [Planctomycetota bacterium]
MHRQRHLKHRTEYTLTRGDKVSGKHTFTGKSSKADTASGTWGSSGSVTLSTDAKPGSTPEASGSITDTMSGKSSQRHSDEVTTTDATETSYGGSSDTRIRTASKIVDRDVSGSTKRVPNADGTFVEQPSTTITTRDSSSSSSTHIHTEGYETPLPGGGTRRHGGTFTDTNTATRGTLSKDSLSTGAGSTGGVRTTSTTHEELTYDVTLDASGRATSRSNGERHSSSSTETAAAADGSGGKLTVKQSSSGTLITYAAGPTGSSTITQVSSAGMEKVTGSANTPNNATGGFLGTTTQTLQSQNGSSSNNVTTEISDTTGKKTLVHNENSITWLDGSTLRTRTTAGTADSSQANSSSVRTTDSFVDVSLVSSGTSLNLGGWEDSFNVLGDLAGDWAPTVIGTFELIAGFANDPGAAIEVVAAAAVTAGEYSIDAGAGAIDSFVDTLNPFSPWVDIPNIGPVFGHEDAYFVGNVAGTIAGMAAGMSIGNIAAGTSSLVACGSLAQKAAKLYTAIDTVAGIANATSNIAAGNASLGDALAFLPVMTVGVQKLRGAPTNCFIAGTLVAVAGVNAGTGTADAGPSSASKPIEEIQVGDFVWARAEHDPSAPAVLQKVVALYRNTAHDLQHLEVVGDQGQSVQIVATDEHPFYVVDVGWTTADAVQVGQKLVGAGGAVLTVVANRDWKPDGGVVVYNFQVEGDHTYFVGRIMRVRRRYLMCQETISFQIPGSYLVTHDLQRQAQRPPKERRCRGSRVWSAELRHLGRSPITKPL